jgi:hypothetical protein
MSLDFVDADTPAKGLGPPPVIGFDMSNLVSANTTDYDNSEEDPMALRFTINKRLSEENQRYSINQDPEDVEKLY